MKLDERAQEVLRPHLKDGEELTHYAFTEGDDWHWTKLLGMNPYYLVGFTGKRAIVSRVSSSWREKSSLSVAADDVESASVEEFKWKRAGITVGDGRILRAKLRSGEELALRYTSDYAHLEGQKAGFGPITEFWSSLPQAT